MALHPKLGRVEQAATARVAGCRTLSEVGLKVAMAAAKLALDSLSGSARR